MSYISTCDHCGKEVNRAHNPETYAVWCSECRQANIAALEALNLQRTDGGLINLKYEGDLTLSNKDNIAKIRTIPPLTKPSPPNNPTPEKFMRAEDVPLGQDIVCGHIRGTVISKGPFTVVGWKKGDPRRLVGAYDPRTAAASATNKVQDFEEYEGAGAWQLVNNDEVVLSSNPFSDLPCKLRDVPLDTEVEIYGTRGTVVAKNNSNQITVAWKFKHAAPTSAIDVKRVVPQAGLDGSIIRSLNDYDVGLNYVGSEPVVMCPTRRYAKSIPLGTKIRWKGYVGTVIGRHQDQGLVIGWKSGEMAWPSCTGSADTTGFDWIPNYASLFQYWQRINNNEIVEIIESEDKMAISVKETQPGQEIDHPKYGRMVVLGAYLTTGERLLGKKEKFEGSAENTVKNNNSNYAYWDKYSEKDGYCSKWFSGSESVTIVGDRILRFGLKVGDRVEIFRKKGREELMDVGHEPDTTAKKVMGTVVGFNASGEPNVYIESSDDPLFNHLNSCNSTIVDKSFLENKSFMDKVNKNPNNFWLIRSDKAFNKLEKKENKMENKDKQSFMEMMKGDATNAAYRVASNQMTKGIKAGILKVMEKQGMGNDKIKALSEMLDSEFGTSLVSLLIGLGLTYVPHISNDPRAQKLATEFRTEGIATAGNMVFDVAIEHFLPVITGALNALPQETTVRVAETPRIETKTNDQLALEQAAHEEETKKTEQVAKA
jgi:hypothetical protein